MDAGRRVLRRGSFGLLLLAVGCRCQPGTHEQPGVSASAKPLTSASAAPPKQLYLPDASAPLVQAPGVANAQPQPAGRCPPEMVDVAGQFCIDRYEVALIDAVSGQPLSPYYHPTRAQALSSFKFWQQEKDRVGPGWAHAMPLPDLPQWQRERQVVPRAIAQRGQVPSGYLSGNAAQLACERAGKRLCSEQEWVFACKGERQTKYPYGPEYRAGVCNVFRESHPAKLLHSDASEGHLDPRLNEVQENGAPLLRRSGEMSECKSQWGFDAIYDMVGNLDEWVDDPAGKFLGGFYSRATREGCDASISAHPREYFDYSLGTRCCR